MILGITGHQDLGRDRTRIDQIHDDLTSIIVSRENIRKGVSCLARGADQLFASILLAEHIPIHALLPCSNYELTLDAGTDRDNYFAILERCGFVETLDFPEPCESAFLAAGVKMLEMVDTMVAVWDGRPARGRGGTGDIVRLATELGIPVVHYNPITRSTYNI